MYSLNLIAATGLMAASAVLAAPRAMLFDGTAAESYSAYLVDDEHSFPEIVPRSMQWAHSLKAQELADCPAPMLIVTTTTVDVTVYVTPSPTAASTLTAEASSSTITEAPCETETDEPPHVTISFHSITVLEPCNDDDDDTMVTATQTSTLHHWQKINITIPASPSTSAMSTSQFNTTASASSSPSRVTISLIPEHTTTSAPVESQTTPLCDEGSTWSWFDTPAATAAFTQDPQSTDCVIDTAVTPVSTSIMVAAATTVSAQPTKTQCVHDEPSGRPASRTTYCGIHGKPAGTYFIAEFIENRPGQAVTEEGCYQFCDSVMVSTRGCQSYRFYANALGAPRCSLYGRGVVESVADLDKNQPDIWYDLACGSPLAEKWHEGMPADHGNKAAGDKKARRFFF
ncbi:hypothetical protein PWT90_02714 [Aphanocladium album]|nr:hypothetical protein PWT90_02714 [Aphanocladium album]